MPTEILNRKEIYQKAEVFLKMSKFIKLNQIYMLSLEFLLKKRLNNQPGIPHRGYKAYGFFRGSPGF